MPRLCLSGRTRGRGRRFRAGLCYSQHMSKMLEEIRQQPGALERTLKSELRTIEKLRRRLRANARR